MKRKSKQPFTKSNEDLLKNLIARFIEATPEKRQTALDSLARAASDSKWNDLRKYFLEIREVLERKALEATKGVKLDTDSIQSATTDTLAENFNEVLAEHQAEVIADLEGLKNA